MRKEKKDGREEPIRKAGKPCWYYVDPVSLPLRGSKDSRKEGMMNETFVIDGELKENMTATYWG